MKILHTDVFRFSIRMKPFTIATGTMDYAQNVFIRIHTDSGIYGVGECSAFPMITGETQETCLAVARDFAKLWKDKDPRAIERRLAELDLFIAGNRTIKSAFDMALYDIAAKANEQPLYKYLGGSKKTIETDITIGIGEIETMAEKALALKNSGATCIKVKLGKEPEQDVARMQKIRKIVGETIQLRIDANQGWSFEEARYALTAMKDLQIQFCEQPMRAWNDDYLPELMEVSPVKIMADESCYTHHDARRLIRAGACHSINIKLAKSGGICEAMKIHELAKQTDVACMIGGMLESRLALSAKLHFAYSADHVIFHDMDTCLLGHLEDPIVNGAKYKGYFLDIDDLPGIGADVDEDFLKKCDCWTV